MCCTQFNFFFVVVALGAVTTVLANRTKVWNNTGLLPTTADRVGVICTFVSWGLFVAALFFPALVLSDGKAISGDVCLYIGWGAVLQGHFGWYAIIPYGLVCGIMAGGIRQPQTSANVHRMATLCIGIGALLVALSSLFIINDKLTNIPVGWSGLHGLESASIVGVGLGFYLWIAAIALIPLIALALCFAPAAWGPFGSIAPEPPAREASPQNQRKFDFRDWLLYGGLAGVAAALLICKLAFLDRRNPLAPRPGEWSQEKMVWSAALLGALVGSVAGLVLGYILHRRRSQADRMEGREETES